MRVRVDLPTLKEACLELVTVNGRPFKMIDDSGFRKLLDPMLEALSGHNKKACVNAENIREEVTLRASRIRKEIQQELGASFFSLKVDVATKLDRAILGVNAQFVSEGKVMLRTLAMKELTNRHTAEYIKSTLVEILEQYDIDLCQIYTITTDNGANMVKSVKLMSAEQGHCTASMDQEAPSTSYEVTGTSRTRYELSESDDFSESDDDSAPFILNVEVLLETLASGDFVEAPSRSILRGIRCAAHTLQLAVDDALKQSTLKDVIAKARTVCKVLRSPSIMVILKKLKRPKPILDCVTRWHSTCDMLTRLLSLKDFCQEMAASNTDLHVPESEWSLFLQIVASLEPARKAAKALQKEALTLGDFYGVWLTCKLEIMKASSSQFSQLLLTAIKKRESSLLENEAFVACVFLDPRYKLLLTEQEKKSAKAHLVNTWNALQNLKKKGEIDLTESNRLSPQEGESSNDDELELMLKAHEAESSKPRVCHLIVIIELRRV